ncbi:MAG: efflux RND transporter periplasmic adaptor subunit [Sandaracinaceae bacterium]|nr:efflux RND transporter periplasmic adaptor subunit [Sandaracinaceae bacterium]
MRERALVSMLLLLASGCSNEPVAAQRPAPAIPVRLEPVDRTPIREALVSPGLVHPRDTYELGFPMGGLVLDVLVEQGAEVRAGDVLARLDPTTARATVTQAREGLSRAERDLDRARLLAEGGSLPRATLEDAETGTNVARANLAAAAFASRHSVLRAPADGWVDVRAVDPGEIVGAGQPLFRVASRERGWVLRVAVPDRVVARIAPGDAATLTLDALPERRLPGSVVEIARTPTPGFGTFDVQVQLEEAPEGITLRTGLVGRASLPHGDTYGASVPVSALVDGHDHDAFVFTVADGHARRAPIRIAFMTGDRAVVAGGLPGVDAVVTTGADRLTDGARVVASEE